MAKLSKADQKQKQLYAKDLFIKGFEPDTISDILSLSELTIKKWRRENDWESAKQASFIALSELRNTVLKSFADLKDGKIPLITPDQAAKYASAFEKLSDKRKTLTYMYEAFEMLTLEFMKNLQSAKSTDDKAVALKMLRTVREKMDNVLSVLTANVANND